MNEERVRKAEQEPMEREEQERSAAAMRRYYADTGYGECPRCGSRSTKLLATGGADPEKQAAAGCCLGFLCLPLVILAPFLFRRPIQCDQQCNICGHQWRCKIEETGPSDQKGP